MAQGHRFDGKSVTIRGTITNLRDTVSRLGNRYFTFDLSDGKRAIRDGAPGFPSSPAPTVRARMARDVLHDWDGGALPDELDGHRVGRHAMARDAAGGAGGAGPGSRSLLHS